MFLKRVSPETDDFALKKISGCEGKTWFNKCKFFYQCYETPLQKYSENKGFAPHPHPRGWGRVTDSLAYLGYQL